MATFEEIAEFAEEICTESSAAEVAVIAALIDLSTNRQELALRFSKWIAEKRKKEKEQK